MLKNQKIWNNMNEIQRDEKDWFIDKNTKQIQSENQRIDFEINDDDSYSNQ